MSRNPKSLAVIVMVWLSIATVSISWLSVLFAMFVQPDLEQIPIEKLIENIQQQIADDPEDSNLQMNLGRVYAMAYADKEVEFQVATFNGGPFDTLQPWLGHRHSHVPFARQAGRTGDAGKGDAGKSREGVDDEANANLDRAIERFRKAVELDDKNLTAKLSLAWCLDQSGSEMESLEAYRGVIAEGWIAEKDLKFGGVRFRSIVAEAASYLKPKLDATSDADEIADLDEKIEAISRIARPITPIAIPLGDAVDFGSVYDAETTVRFDADGSGVEKNWTWIKPGAGWLVYDQKGDGKIKSALQLFGNVTFWCFWSDGYQAMKSLDENGDRFLSGTELQHVAIWQDKNSNGISDAGEVRTLESHGIVGLRCTASEYRDEQANSTLR